MSSLTATGIVAVTLGLACCAGLFLLMLPKSFVDATATKVVMIAILHGVSAACGLIARRSHHHITRVMGYSILSWILFLTVFAVPKCSREWNAIYLYWRYGMIL